MADDLSHLSRQVNENMRRLGVIERRQGDQQVVLDECGFSKLSSDQRASIPAIVVDFEYTRHRRKDQEKADRKRRNTFYAVLGLCTFFGTIFGQYILEFLPHAGKP